MLNNGKKKIIFAALVSSLTVAADQASKYLICVNLSRYDTVTVIPGLFDIVHIRNTGIAFGLFKQFGSQYRMVSLALIGVIAVVLIGYLITQVNRSRMLETTSLALVLGGALGNLIDRLFRQGEVVDFLDVYWKSWHWPAFNIADSAISVGIAVYVVCELFINKRHSAGKGRNPCTHS